MHTLQSDLPKFCFAELGSKFGSPLKDNLHNFYKLQKEHVTAFQDKRQLSALETETDGLTKPIHKPEMHWNLVKR